MSMPQPIQVALVGSTVAQVAAAKKHFRLSAPGIGSAYLSALDATPRGEVVPPSELPKALLTLWLCLDKDALAVAQHLHSQDAQNPRYGRGFYDEHFPQPCVLIETGPSSPKLLSDWARQIIEAWYATS